MTAWLRRLLWWAPAPVAAPPDVEQECVVPGCRARPGHAAVWCPEVGRWAHL